MSSQAVISFQPTLPESTGCPALPGPHEALGLKKETDEAYHLHIEPHANGCRACYENRRSVVNSRSRTWRMRDQLSMFKGSCPSTSTCREKGMNRLGLYVI